MAATKTHLRLVNADVMELPVRAATTLARQENLLAEQHDNACIAALMPDVLDQRRETVARALAAIAKPGADLHAILDDLCRRMYLTGHMDGAADSRTAALAELTLASVTAIDGRRRAAEAGGDPA